MARGKNTNRRRASLDSPPSSPTSTLMTPSSPPGDGDHMVSRLGSGVGHSSFYHAGAKTASILPPPGTLNPAEVQESIDFHWKNLSFELRDFLLKNANELSLQRLVSYWTKPSQVDNTSPNIAASICGCSWYLALQYMSIGKIVEARALILNGCFLQQCFNMPITEIIAISKSSSSGGDFSKNLRYFADGMLAISSQDRMANFLRNKVSSDYQRRMSFATQTKQTKKHVADYINQISSDWDTGRGASQRQRNERRRRASLDSLPAGASFIDIKLIDFHTKEESTMKYGQSMPLKSLFKKYAEDNNLNLRQLRFSYEGRTLFLSSVGSKSAEDLGIGNLDSIFVHNSAVQEEASSSSSDESKNNKENSKPKKKDVKKSKKRPARSKCRRASWDGPASPIDEQIRLKLIHSRQLTCVFDEASPKFEEIRQKLNTLNLVCTPPKIKMTRKKLPVGSTTLPFVDNPCSDGIGGKAGVPFYSVHVGEADNLYKVTKPLRSRGPALSIDLHGLTRDEAMKELNEVLPKWVNVAQRGEYPWVIPAVIICGGGNQILSEAVDQWIKSNENVAKAPKNKFRRRRATQ